MAIGLAPDCFFCKHYDRSPSGPWKCTAFPDGVPPEIIQRRVEHTSPYPGDHGVQFDLASDRREWYDQCHRFMETMKALREQNIREGIGCR